MKNCFHTAIKGLFYFYKFLIAPFLFVSGFQLSCRFYPSCSCYAKACMIKNGPLKGTFYTFKRLLRCHPFAQGGVDFPPNFDQFT